jgi:hypothetical protein
MAQGKVAGYPAHVLAQGRVAGHDLH